MVRFTHPTEQAVLSVSWAYGTAWNNLMAQSGKNDGLAGCGYDGQKNVQYERGVFGEWEFWS
jgi:hypothetical protein